MEINHRFIKGNVKFTALLEVKTIIPLHLSMNDIQVDATTVLIRLTKRVEISQGIIEIN